MVSSGNGTMFSMIRCLFGSSMNGDPTSVPAVLSTMMRISCRMERVDASPMYTNSQVSQNDCAVWHTMAQIVHMNTYVAFPFGLAASSSPCISLPPPPRWLSQCGRIESRYHGVSLSEHICESWEQDVLHVLLVTTAWEIPWPSPGPPGHHPRSV